MGEGIIGFYNEWHRNKKRKYIQAVVHMDEKNHLHVVGVPLEKAKSYYKDIINDFILKIGMFKASSLDKMGEKFF